MFNIINKKSSKTLYEEMKLEPKGYGLRDLEEGKVRVPEKGKKSCNGFHYMGLSCGIFYQSTLEKHQ